MKSYCLALRIFIFFALAFIILPGPAYAETLRVWHAYKVGGEEEQALSSILDAWKAKNPGHEIETLALPFDAFKTKLTSAISIGEGPDIYLDAHERLGDYVSRGIVGEANAALESENAFIPSALSAVRVGGKLYGLPLSTKCVALYINTKLAQEAPAYFEDFESLKGTLPKGVYPLVYEAQNAYFHGAILGAFGLSLLAPEDQYGFFGKDAEKSLEIVRQFLRNGTIPEDADGALVGDLFKSGRAAFVISGPWFADGLSGALDHYRVVPLPKLKASGQPLRPMLTVEAVMMSPKGAQRELTRSLAQWISGLEAAKIRTQKVKVPPVRADIDVNTIGLTERDQAFLKAFTDQSKDAIPIPSALAMSAAWDVSGRAMKKALRRVDLTPETVLSEAKRRFDDIRRPPPPSSSPVPLAILIGLIGIAMAYKWLKNAQAGNTDPTLKQSLPAYKYLIHAVLAVGLLVFVPLFVGAATSLFIGNFAGGWENLRYVGFTHFISILSARGGPLFTTGSFYVVLLVTIFWTVCNLALHVGIGVALALLLSRPTLRFKALYRVLLIVPWAVPSYVTALSWKGMFHRQFGAVNGLIHALSDLMGTSTEPISWFSQFSTAFVANLSTNVWLGFPFMMVVTLGALTSVPDDVLEAAKVDGATRFQRLRLVTLPMIAPVLAPSITLGAIWTFNMFNVIYLVSGGDPDGATEILVSEAYRWAFNRDGQYGYAAAYSVLIFFLLTFITRITSRNKKPESAAAAPASPPETPLKSATINAPQAKTA